MRSARGLALVAGAVVALSAFAIGASASSSPHALHITKDCSTYDGVTPTYCTVTSSSLKAIPVHAKIWYKGPILTNAFFLSSNMLIDAWHGNTTTGYCNFDAQTADGICAFWKGTGTLTGFHAVVHVTIDAKGVWHWDGTYYFPGKP
jgi:hypothetical protein